MKRVLAIVLLMGIMVGLSACADSESGESDDKEKAEVIYEDEYIKVTNRGFEKDDSTGMELAMFLVDIENKTDQEITVLPMDSSVDDTMVQFTSGIPATMQGKKKISQAWGIGKDLPKEKIQLSLSICDSEMSELRKTEMITVNK